MEEDLITITEEENWNKALKVLRKSKWRKATRNWKSQFKSPALQCTIV